MATNKSLSPEVGSAGFPITPAGQRWLENNPHFMDTVHKFCAAESKAEAVFDDDDSYTFVAQGRTSTVYRTGDAAVIVSTPTTANNNGWGKPYAPANLRRKFKFMAALEKHWEETPDISVPAQGFAVVAPNRRNQIIVEQFMDGWKTVNQICADLHWRPWQQEAAHKTIESRVDSATVGLRGLRLQLGLHLDNSDVLLQTGGSTIDPRTDKLCIIDQPGDGLLGIAAMPIRNPSTERLQIGESDRLVVL